MDFNPQDFEFDKVQESQLPVFYFFLEFPFPNQIELKEERPNRNFMNIKIFGLAKTTILITNKSFGINTPYLRKTNLIN